MKDNSEYMQELPGRRRLTTRSKRFLSAVTRFNTWFRSWRTDIQRRVISQTAHVPKYSIYASHTHQGAGVKSFQTDVQNVIRT